MALPKNAFRTIRLAAGAATGVAAAAGGATLAARKLFSAKPSVRNELTPQGEPVRILKVGGGFQSVTYTEESRRFDLVLEYYRTFDMLFEFGLPVTSVLALGAGGCAWPKHAAFAHPEVRVDAIEADPEVAKLAHKHFFIDDLPEQCQFTLHESDALDFLLKAQEEGTRYSVVVNDCFEGKRFDEGTLAKETLELTKRCMEENGLYAVNVVSARNGKSLRNVKKATKALNRVFAHVFVFPSADLDFGGEDNYVLVATDGTYSLEKKDSPA